jgi:hypothetical protein
MQLEESIVEVWKYSEVLPIQADEPLAGAGIICDAGLRRSPGIGQSMILWEIVEDVPT